jgi:hypothetical protein
MSNIDQIFIAGPIFIVIVFLEEIPIEVSIIPAQISIILFMTIPLIIVFGISWGVTWGDDDI